MPLVCPHFNEPIGFPEAKIVSQIPRKQPGINFGPFSSRVALRRSSRDSSWIFSSFGAVRKILRPSPNHPGCVYGEMGMCLRPCQEQVGTEEYRNMRWKGATEFLATSGTASAQCRTSRFAIVLAKNMDFEEAARQHKRIEKIEEVRKLRDEMALPRRPAACHRDYPELKLRKPVELSIFRAGHWQGTRRLSFHLVEGKPISLDWSLRANSRTTFDR